MPFYPLATSLISFLSCSVCFLVGMENHQSQIKAMQALLGCGIRLDAILFRPLW